MRSCLQDVVADCCILVGLNSCVRAVLRSTLGYIVIDTVKFNVRISLED